MARPSGSDKRRRSHMFSIRFSREEAIQFDSCENYGLRDSNFGRAIIISKRADQLIFVAGDLKRYVDVNGVLTA